MGSAFFPLTVNDPDHQRLASAVDGLPPVCREVLLNALAQVGAPKVREWLADGKLREWVQQGLHICTEKGARGAQLVPAFFAATPVVLSALTQGEIPEWVRAVSDIEGAGPSQPFVALPDGFADLAAPERLSFYRLVRTAAARAPHVAASLYRSLPSSIHTLPVSEQRLLFRCLQAAATFDPDPLPAVLPFLGPTLRALPPGNRGALLERIARLAQIFPAGVARLFRALSRAYDEAGAERVHAWIVAGEEIARRNAQAGEAFFALESRTSLLLLRHASPRVLLSDVHGLLLKYLHMLCGVAVGITEGGDVAFPPPLVKAEGDLLPLPAAVDVFPTYEENFRLYRVLAAHQAGRVEFGTYALSLPAFWPCLPGPVRELLGSQTQPPDTLDAYCRLFPHPERMHALFVYVESTRVAHRLAASYKGLQADLAWADTLTQLLPPVLLPLLPRLPSLPWQDVGEEATVYDSLLFATELYVASLSAAAHASFRREVGERAEHAKGAEDAGAETTALAEGGGDGPEGARLSAEEQAVLRKIMAALRDHPGKRKTRRGKETVAVLSWDAGTAADTGEQEERQGGKKNAIGRRLRTAEGLRYLYDEWDYLIEDYRTQWCQLRELPLQGDEGAFFSRTLEAYAEVAPEIKRELQRLRPRLYRHMKGLEDGEDIDLDAAVVARVDLRTGVAPSPKLYAARQPVERDVAALFLLDMSASTDMRLAEREDVRVIDVLKEAVVLLAAALEEIGDAYAIYGFSSHGRQNVEVYPVKTFAEPLSPGVQGRISAIAPKRSTRMGAAVRHAARKLKDLSSRAKLLVLISDGHPEDVDYGREPHTPAYGLRDTMMALREAERGGVQPFCLTIDKGGHDYLREMLPPARYMVIEDVLTLPLELPKIYQRHIREPQR
jgi:hypothetical protein